MTFNKVESKSTRLIFLQQIQTGHEPSLDLLFAAIIGLKKD